MKKQGSCLDKEIMQGIMPGACRRGRPRTAWMDNIKTWTGLSVEELIKMTEDRDKWRKQVHGVTSPRIEDGYRTEQNELLMLSRSGVLTIDWKMQTSGIQMINDRTSTVPTMLSRINFSETYKKLNC